MDVILSYVNGIFLVVGVILGIGAMSALGGGTREEDTGFQIGGMAVTESKPNPPRFGLFLRRLLFSAAFILVAVGADRLRTALYGG